MAEWLVARTKPCREQWAAENVARQGYRFYLPRLLVRRKRGPRVDEVLPSYLFPSYIFVSSDGEWHWLNSTFGIVSVLALNDGPAILRDADYQALRSREDVNGYIQLPHQQMTIAKFKPGQVVRINGGAFQGMQGIYQESTAKDRVRILLDYLGRKSSVLITADLLDEAV